MDSIDFDQDILDNSSHKVSTSVLMGEQIGVIREEDLEENDSTNDSKSDSMLVNEFLPREALEQTEKSINVSAEETIYKSEENQKKTRRKTRRKARRKNRRKNRRKTRRKANRKAKEQDKLPENSGQNRDIG